MFGNLFSRFENHALSGQIQQALQESDQVLSELKAFDQQYQQNPQAYADPQDQQILSQLKSGVAQLLQAHNQLQSEETNLDDHAGIQQLIQTISCLCSTLRQGLQQVSQHNPPSFGGQQRPPENQQAGQNQQSSGSGGSGLFGDLMLASAFGIGGGMLGDALMGGMGGSGSGNSGSGNSGSGNSGSGNSNSGHSGSGSGNSSGSGSGSGGSGGSGGSS